MTRNNNSHEPVFFDQYKKELFSELDIEHNARVTLFLAKQPEGASPLLGTRWTAAYSPESLPYRLTSICWSPELGVYVAVAPRGVLVSSDGWNWTAKATLFADADDANMVIEWSPLLRLFVVGNGELADTKDQGIFVSKNGLDWKRVYGSTQAPLAVRGITWASGLKMFVVCGDNNCRVSKNGINWDVVDVPPGKWRNGCYSSSLKRLIVFGDNATGGGSFAMWSSNGYNWTPLSDPAIAGDFSESVYSEKLQLFVAGNSQPTAGTAAFISSKNGVDWTVTGLLNFGCRSIAWAADRGVFTAVSGSGTAPQIGNSPDGVSWTFSSSPASASNWTSLCYSSERNQLVGVAADASPSGRIIVSP